MAKRKKRASSRDTRLDAARKKVWAEFRKLSHDEKAKHVVLETKRRLRALGCGHLSVRRGRGTARCMISVTRKNPGERLSPKEVVAIAEVFDRDPGARTNAVSMQLIEAEMRLGLRRKEPLCSSCGSTFKTERDALNCLRSH